MTIMLKFSTNSRPKGNYKTSVKHKIRKIPIEPDGRTAWVEFDATAWGGARVSMASAVT